MHSGSPITGGGGDEKVKQMRIKITLLMHVKGNMGLQCSYVKCCGNLRCALRHDGYEFISCCVLLCIMNCTLDLYIVPY
jgi:hypothetical protein